MPSSVYKAFLVGGESVGKTTLLSRIRQQKDSTSSFNPRPLPTLGVDFIRWSDGKFQLWDASGSELHRATTEHFISREDRDLSKQNDALIICIDLASVETAEKQFSNYEAIIKKYKERTGTSGSLIFVGTKAEKHRTISDAELAALASKHGAESFVTSAIETGNKGVKALIAHLDELASRKLLGAGAASATAAPAAAAASSTKLSASGDTFPLMTRAIRRLSTDSRLHESLSVLREQIEHIDHAKAMTIEVASDRLVTQLLNPRADKAQAINYFQQTCHEALGQSAGKKILNAVLTVACVAVVTVIAAAIGFGIGFAWGVWLGPGAFITGVLGATSAAALTVAMVSGAAGVAAGVGAGHRLFQPSVASKLVDNVVDAAKDPEPTSDHGTSSL